MKEIHNGKSFNPLKKKTITRSQKGRAIFSLSAIGHHQRSALTSVFSCTCMCRLGLKRRFREH